MQPPMIVNFAVRWFFGRTTTSLEGLLQPNLAGILLGVGKGTAPRRIGELT
jgi:hypothetical protein